MPLDPLRLGQLTLAIRRPGTRLILEQEFGLTRRQAHAIVVRLQSHTALKRKQRRLMIRFWGAALLGLLVVLVILGPIAWTAYLDWASSRPESEPLNLVITIAIPAVLGFGTVLLWIAAERWLQDRLVTDELRRCWNDQECIWCGRDMDGCIVDRERWARCPECGLRSPIGARASTI